MPATPDLLQQAAAIPVQAGRLWLVTSRSGKRWVVPKGCLELGKSAGEIALQEAWEEAGLVGLLDPEPVGTYFYQKAGLTCHVTVFLLRVTGVADDWPESALRQRSCLSFAQAEARIADQGLRQLVRGVASAPVG